MNKVDGKIEIYVDRLVFGDPSEQAAFIEELFDIYDSMVCRINVSKLANEEENDSCEVNARNSRIDADFLIVEFIKEYMMKL